MTMCNQKPWCDRHDVVVLDVVKRQFKDRVGEMENMHNDAEEKHENSLGWTTFEDEENLHPNISVHQDKSSRSNSINPFSYGYKSILLFRVHLADSFGPPGPSAMVQTAKEPFASARVNGSFSFGVGEDNGYALLK
ncbi:hypothetical protein CR513_36025, partial [Mucuna pruriens]